MVVLIQLSMSRLTTSRAEWLALDRMFL